MYRMALLVGLFSIFAASAPAGSTPPDVKSAAAAPAVPSNDGFLPRISLTSIRFGFRASDGADNRVFAELVHPQTTLLLAMYPEADDAAAFRAFHGVLDNGAQEKVLAHIPESLGDAYTLIDPVTLEHSNARLVALSYWPTGDGRFSDFAAVLMPDREPFAQGKGFFLVVPGGWADKIRVAASEDGQPTAEEKAKIAETLSLHLGDQTVEPLQFHRVHLTRGEPAWAMQFTSGDGATRLAGLYQNTRKNWRVTTFSEDVGSLAEAASMVVEDYLPETDYAFMNSRLLVLPDLDGNGCSELLILSDTRYHLLSIDHHATREGPGRTYRDHYTIRSVHHLYSGC